jgi:hypothetical protein
VYRIRPLECAKVHGRFYLTTASGSYCGPASLAYKGCSILDNADGPDVLTRIIAEPGEEYVVDRYEMTSPDAGACPATCN